MNLYPIKVTTSNAIQAEDVRSNLTAFECVVALLEGDTIRVRGAADITVQKIIALCKAEQQRQLALYDILVERSTDR